MTQAHHRRQFRARLAFIVLFNAAFLLWMKKAPGSPAFYKAANDLISLSVCFIGTYWAFKRSRQPGQPPVKARFRRASDLVGFSLLSYMIGEAVWAYYEVFRHIPVPFPSWADAFFLADYFLLMIGILMMPTRPIPAAVRGRVLLDSLMVMTGLVTFSWYFILGPTVLQGGETLLGRILGVGYPLGDLCVLFCLLVLSAHPAEAATLRSRRLLIWGILAYVLSDLGFGYLTLKGTYSTGAFTDIGWTLGNLLLGLGVADYRHSVSQTVPLEKDAMPTYNRNPILWRALLPYIFVPAVAALLLYTFHQKDDAKLEPGVYLGSAVLIGLVLLRQVFAMLENNRLYRYLQETYQELEADRRSLSEANARLETLATTDGMTGLPNHRVFQERIRQELAQAKQQKTSVFLLMLDVDHFKKYNDSFGHPAGDEALRSVAAILRKTIRPEDFCARYGGEEFAVILSALSAEEAAEIAERIRGEAEAHPFAHRQVTLSIGAASLTDVHEEAKTLIARADAALYGAKQNGRNRVYWEKGEAAACPALTLSKPAKPTLSEFESLAMSGFLASLDLRDSETEGHCQRVARYTLRLSEKAQEMGVISLTQDEHKTLLMGALLHDVGKIGTPDRVLRKAGRLDASEWEQMCRHPLQGADLLSGTSCLHAALPVVLSHHEQWDGSGYPAGLTEIQIPLAARLFAIADALDAMTSDRPYRKALSFETAREEIARKAGTQFDPALVRAFLTLSTGDWLQIRDAGSLDGRTPLAVQALPKAA